MIARTAAWAHLLAKSGLLASFVPPCSTVNRSAFIRYGAVAAIIASRALSGAWPSSLPTPVWFSGITPLLPQSVMPSILAISRAMASPTFTSSVLFSITSSVTRPCG